jgi:hypothetical protein
MNDFTKEELEYIRKSLGPFCGDDSAENDPYSRYLPGLYTKVDDMIDNYCNHEYQYSILDNSLQCKKCTTFLIPSKIRAIECQSQT